MCQPSVNESFSIVLMEAWLAGTPVLVHARCPVTTHHVFQAGGGLAFEDFYEFAEALDLLLEDRAADTGWAARAGPTSRRSTAGRRSPRASTRPWSGSLPDTLAFVVPWYGPDIAGGAEAECRATARALRDRGVPVEILTTCARDHASPWADHHPDGVTEEDGFVVRRFKVRPRDPERYGRLQWRLDLGGSADVVRGGGLRPRVRQLERPLRLPGAERDRYWYAFIPYCFGTTWEGALVAPERSLLIPCLHDEPFAHLKWTRRVLGAVRAACFHVRGGARIGRVPGRGRTRSASTWSARASIRRRRATPSGSAEAPDARPPSSSMRAGRRRRRTRRSCSSTSPGTSSPIPTARSSSS